MTEKHPCTAVDMRFFDTAPFRYVAEETIAASADAVFASFENADDWPLWAPPIQRVDWTSSKPLGVGSTRTVFMSGGMTGYEEFIAWERGREMAFCFTHASKNNVESFAEHYVVYAINEACCRVRWVMAMKPRGFSRYFLPLFSPFMQLGVKVMLRRFRNLLQQRRQQLI